MWVPRDSVVPGPQKAHTWSNPRLLRPKGLTYSRHKLRDCVVISFQNTHSFIKMAGVIRSSKASS